MRILSVVGNRPQFIKSAPLSLALRNRADEVVLHTGQHYDHELSQVFFDELALAPPDHRLEAGSGSHGEQTARMLPGIEAAASRTRIVEGQQRRDILLRRLAAIGTPRQRREDLRGADARRRFVGGAAREDPLARRRIACAASRSPRATRR